MLTDRIYRSLSGFPAFQGPVGRIVRRLPHRRRRVARFGQQFIVDPSELSGFYLYYEREYDDFVFRFLDEVIRKYSTAFDIGANIGIYACYLAARVRSVIAFEPDPSLCAWLKRNLALNGLCNVTVHEACVGLDNGNVRFFPADNRNQGTGNIIRESGSGIERACIRLDDFLPSVRERPCLIKMDIEGAEWLALRGAQQELARPDALIDILLEIHPEEIKQAGGTVGKLKKLLIDLGYSVAALTTQGLLLGDGVEEQRFWWVSRYL